MAAPTILGERTQELQIPYGNVGTDITITVTSDGSTALDISGYNEVTWYVAEMESGVKVISKTKTASDISVVSVNGTNDAARFKMVAADWSALSNSLEYFHQLDLTDSAGLLIPAVSKGKFTVEDAITAS